MVGAKVFAGTCAACHNGGGNILAAEKTLEREALEEYLDGGLNEAAIIRQVGHGGGRDGGGGGEGGGVPSGAPARRPAGAAAARRLLHSPLLPEPGRPIRARPPLLVDSRQATGPALVA